MVFLKPSRWYCQYILNGFPKPSIWYCRYHLDSIAGTIYMVLEIPSRWFLRRMGGGTIQTFCIRKGAWNTPCRAYLPNNFFQPLACVHEPKLGGSVSSLMVLRCAAPVRTRTTQQRLPNNWYEEQQSPAQHGVFKTLNHAFFF